MAINYPIIMPNLPGPERLKLRVKKVAGRAEGGFDFTDQVFDWPSSDRWELGVTLPVLTRVQAQPWMAALDSLRGRTGTFLFGDRLAVPLGSAAGVPFVTGVQASASKTLLTRNWTPSQTGVQKAGDQLQIAKNQLAVPAAFDNAAWIKTQCTVTATNILAPDGTTTAERVTPNGGATDANVRQAFVSALLAGRPFVGYLWMKAASGTPTISLHLMNQSSVARGTTICPLTTSWQLFLVSGTMLAGDTSADMVVGGALTWVEAEGAIDMWGASLSSVSLDARLHTVLADADADVNGNATFDVSPVLREATSDFSRIITSSPKGIFRLASDGPGYELGRAGEVYVAFEALEVK